MCAAQKGLIALRRRKRVTKFTTSTACCADVKLGHGVLVESIVEVKVSTKEDIVVDESCNTFVSVGEALNIFLFLLRSHLRSHLRSTGTM